MIHHERIQGFVEFDQYILIPVCFEDVLDFRLPDVCDQISGNSLGFHDDAFSARDDFYDHGIGPVIAVEHPVHLVQLVRFQQVAENTDQVEVVPLCFLSDFLKVCLLKIGKLDIQQKNGKEDDPSYDRRNEKQNRIFPRHGAILRKSGSRRPGWFRYGPPNLRVSGAG